MEIRTINIARQKNWANNLVQLIFRAEITVSKEVQSYTLLSLVAEVFYFTLFYTHFIKSGSILAIFSIKILSKLIRAAIRATNLFLFELFSKWP